MGLGIEDFLRGTRSQRQRLWSMWMMVSSKSLQNIVKVSCIVVLHTSCYKLILYTSISANPEPSWPWSPWFCVIYLTISISFSDLFHIRRQEKIKTNLFKPTMEPKNWVVCSRWFSFSLLGRALAEEAALAAAAKTLVWGSRIFFPWREPLGFNLKLPIFAS